jgi:hypothetical protein
LSGDGALLPDELGLFLNENTLYYEKVLFSQENLSLFPWKVHCFSKKLFVLKKKKKKISWETCLGLAISLLFLKNLFSKSKKNI